MMQGQQAGQQRFNADRAVSGLCERLAFGFCVLRIVTGDDDINRAVGNAADQRQPVFFAAQRRRQLGEGAVVFDIVLVEHEMRRRNAAGDFQAAGFGGAHRVNAFGRRNLRDVVAAAGQFDQPQVAVDHRRFRRCRNAGQAEPRRQLALMHDAGALQILIHGVLHDERVKGRGIGQGAAHGQRVHDGAVAVGEGDSPGLAQQADFGHPLALAAARQRRHRVHADNGRVAGAPRNEIDQRRIVDHRIGVRHGDDGGDAAGRRRL